MRGEIPIWSRAHPSDTHYLISNSSSQGHTGRFHINKWYFCSSQTPPIQISYQNVSQGNSLELAATGLQLATITHSYSGKQTRQCISNILPYRSHCNWSLQTCRLDPPEERHSFKTEQTGDCYPTGRQTDKGIDWQIRGCCYGIIYLQMAAMELTLRGDNVILCLIS